MTPGAADLSARVSIGLVGGGKGGSAVLDLILDWPEAKVAVLVDPREEAPGLRKAQALGIPTAAHHLEVFAYPVDLVLEVTGQPAVLDDLLRAKPPGVQVIGAGSLRFFWDLLQDKIKGTRQLRAQLDMALALGSTLDPDQQIAIVTRKLAQACDVDRCTIFLWDEATGLVTPLMSQFATAERAGRMWDAFKGLGSLKLAEVPFLYEVMERRNPIEIVDPATSRLMPRGWAELFETKSVLVLPIFRKKRVVMACTLDYCRESRRFTPDQTALATALAEQVALALENAHLHQEVAEKAKRLASLLDITKRTVSIRDSSQLLPGIVREAALFLKAEAAGIRILAGEELVSVAHYGFSQEGVRERVTVGEGGSGWAVRHNQPLAISDLEGDPRIVRGHRALWRREGFHSVLIVPMQVGGRPIGTLFVLSKSRRFFSPAEIEVLSGFADQAALAIQNARLFEEAERRRQMAESLAEVGHRISQSLDSEEVGQLIADSVLVLLGARTAALFRLEPESGDLVSLAVSGEMGRLFGGNLVLSRGTGVGALAVRERQPVVTPDFSTDSRIVLAPEVRGRLAQAEFRAVLVVPLLIKDRVIGTLGVGDRAGRVFGPEEIRLMQAFADQAAIALENARLFGELRAALEQVEASQHRLVQTERLRALGEMAAGVAHDFNNLLAIILGRAELLLTRVREPELIRGLEAVRKAALDGAQTVRRIQEFTRTRRTRPFGQVDLRELLLEVVELTRPRWKDGAQSRGVTYEVGVEGGPVPPVAGIAEELREVLTNLLTNALEAMPGGGRFAFRVSTEGEWVVVRAEDTGAGMSAETCRRVFEPFFTTKGPRVAGLGLAVAWGIATRHGGTIHVESTLGVGSTFTVRLPRSQEIPSEDKSEPAPRPRRGARVVVIDDEAEVRAVLRDLLAGEGYAVLEAAEGAEGLARCEAEPVDLVLTDLSMPRMSGWEVAAACQERFPRLPVGLVTGWGDQLDPDKLQEHRVRFVLAKPFVASDVLREVARALLS